MRRSVFTIVILAFLLAPIIGTAPRAEVVNGRFPFEAGSWIHVALSLGDVSIEDVKFHRPPKWKGMMIRHDKPNRATVVARNRGSRRLDVGVAIAVFAEDGSLVAAGNSGPTLGVLQPGERHEFDVHFHSVYREIDQGAEFLIAAEF